MSQGAEIEITPIIIGYLDPNTNQVMQVANGTNWEMKYNTKLFTTVGASKFPVLYLTTDNNDNRGIMELVTGPVMYRTVGSGAAYNQLTCELLALINYLNTRVRDASAPYLLLRDVIKDFNKTVGQATKCRPLIPTQQCLQREIAIDVSASRSEMEKHNKRFIAFFRKSNEPWAKTLNEKASQTSIMTDGMTIYTQHSGTIPIQRLHLDSTRELLLELIWGTNRITLLNSSFEAGNAVVDGLFLPLSGKTEKADHRALRKLRGLMILTFYVLHMGVAAKEHLDGITGTPKNRFDIMPRNPLRDVVRAGLSKSARDLLFKVMTDSKLKMQLYDRITQQLRLTFGDQTPCGLGATVMTEHPCTVLDLLENAFQPDPSEVQQGTFGTEQLSKTDPKRASATAVGEPYALKRNIDDRPEKHPENAGVIRNLLFEGRSSVVGTAHSSFAELAAEQRVKLSSIWDLLSS